MSMKSAVLPMAFIVSAGIFWGTPAGAQTLAGTPQQSTMNPHHQRITEIMKDMTQAMGNMSERMSHGPLTPEQSKQMSRQMERMSKMMRMMSGLESRPAMKDLESQKQMGLMRKQMDEMMRDMSMGPTTKK